MKRLICIAFLLFALSTVKGQVMMLFSSDSLTGITSPLGIDSLVLWLRADAGVLDSLSGSIANNEGVGTWQDQSGQGKHVIQDTTGKRPIYKATGGPNSYPTFQFDGVNDYLRSTANMNIVGNEARHIFVVARSNSGDAYSGLLGFGDNTLDYKAWDFFAVYTISAVLKSIAVNDGSGASYYNAAPTQDIYRLFECGFTEADANSADIDLREDGTSRAVTVQAISGTINTANTTFKIGTNYVNNAAGKLSGYLCEVLVYDKELTSSEQTAIRNYLNKKYDLY